MTAQHYRKVSQPTTLKEIVKPKIDITNAKKREIKPDLVGKQIGTGSYKYETLTKSKITEGDSAKLVIAANDQSGGHFVLAFLGGGNIPTANQLEPGWSLQAIADDPMWAPGACSSKPTFLLGDKYIFIDDGKTKDTDKYNSYILFNMQTAEYHYIGGSNFTPTQGNKEQILLAANENDKLVFYIDPIEDHPYIVDDGSLPGHIKGKDHSYIIRRVIDPETFDYTDYSLPFNVPDDLTNYYVRAYNEASGVSFQVSAPYINGVEGPSYDGKLADNSIKLTPTTPPDYNYDGNDSVTDSTLELQLDPSLRQTLSDLVTKQKPDKDTPYKTMFTAVELGTYQQLKFLNVEQRFGEGATGDYKYDTYMTPAIFDTDKKQVYTMVTGHILTNSSYVNLGVF